MCTCVPTHLGACGELQTSMPLRPSAYRTAPALHRAVHKSAPIWHSPWSAYKRTGGEERRAMFAANVLFFACVVVTPQGLPPDRIGHITLTPLQQLLPRSLTLTARTAFASAAHRYCCCCYPRYVPFREATLRCTCFLLLPLLCACALDNAAERRNFPL